MTMQSSFELMAELVYYQLDCNVASLFADGIMSSFLHTVVSFEPARESLRSSIVFTCSSFCGKL